MMTGNNGKQDAPEMTEEEEQVSDFPFAAEEESLDFAASLEPPQEVQITPEQVIAALEAQLSEHKDQHLRSLAEMENLRRRTERQVSEARQYAVTGFARDLLTVADNLERALGLADDADETEGGVVEGIKLTGRELQSVLERHGVKSISPVGERFDPNFHQAMFEIEDASQPTGIVLQIVQTGFVIGDRVLRPAMVGISKGGPKVAPIEDTTADAGESEALDPSP